MNALVRTAIVTLIASCVFPAVGQQPASDIAATTQPAAETPAFWLRVTGDRVYLRSRPDQNSVPVAQLDEGSILRGRSEEHGWFRVDPPEGVFSYASAQYIEQGANGRGEVAVRSGGLRVRVGSLVQNVDPLKAEVQALLERGDEVKILGQDGEWLRIAPPAGVSLYISTDFADRVSAADAGQISAPVRLSTTATSQPAAPAATQPTPQIVRRPPPTTQPAQPEIVPIPKRSANLSGPWGQRLLRVEDEIAAERQRPLPHDWEPLIGQLEIIAGQTTDLPVARLAQGWIAQLRQRQSDEATLERVKGSRKK